MSPKNEYIEHASHDNLAWYMDGVEDVGSEI